MHTPRFSKGGKVAEFLLKRLQSAQAPKLARLATEAPDGTPLPGTEFTAEQLRRLAEAKIILRRKHTSDLLGPGRRMVNVHENLRTATPAGGERARSIRMNTEPEMFGGTDVNYGYLTEDPLSQTKISLSERWPDSGGYMAPDDVLNQYGPYGFELSPAGREKATFTLGDSLDDGRGPYATAGSLLEPSVPWHDLGRGGGSMLEQLAKEYDAVRSVHQAELAARNKDGLFYSQQDMSDDLDKIMRERGYSGSFREYLRDQGGGDFVESGRFTRLAPRPVGALESLRLMPTEKFGLQDLDSMLRAKPEPYLTSYIEAQVHGGVTPEDISRMYDFNYEPSAALERKLRKFGIDYVPMPEDNIVSRIRKSGVRSVGDLVDTFGPEVLLNGQRYSLDRGPLPRYDGKTRNRDLLPFKKSFARGGRVGGDPNSKSGPLSVLGGLLDMGAGTLRGGVKALLGLPGDLEQLAVMGPELARMGWNAVSGADLMSGVDQADLAYEPTLWGSDYWDKKLPPLTGLSVPPEKNVYQSMGEFAPIVPPKVAAALGRGARTAAKTVGREALRSVDNAMQRGTGPLASALAPSRPAFAVRPRGGNFTLGAPETWGDWIPENLDTENPVYKWQNKQLRNYIKRDLGAPTDPLLELEKELPNLHFGEGAWPVDEDAPRLMYQLREGHRAGNPSEPQRRAAEYLDKHDALSGGAPLTRWGRAADAHVIGQPAGAQMYEEWAQKWPMQAMYPPFGGSGPKELLAHVDMLLNRAEGSPSGSSTRVDKLRKYREELASALETDWRMKDPNAPVWEMMSGAPNQLGFNHVADYLDEATYPYTRLHSDMAVLNDEVPSPAQVQSYMDDVLSGNTLAVYSDGELRQWRALRDAGLLIDPAKLERMSVPDVVRKTAAWNEFLANKMNAADGPLAQGWQVFKDYGPEREGMKWVEFAPPKVEGVERVPVDFSKLPLLDSYGNPLDLSELRRSPLDGGRVGLVDPRSGEILGMGADEAAAIEDLRKKNGARASNVMSEDPDGVWRVDQYTGELPPGYTLEASTGYNQSRGGYYLDENDPRNWRVVGQGPGSMTGWAGHRFGPEYGPGIAKAEFMRTLAEDKLRSGLAAEGDAMGHCVGGYCSDVISGGTKIYSLRDAKGNPHVTIEVAAGGPARDQYGARLRQLDRAARDDYNDWLGIQIDRNPDFRRLDGDIALQQWADETGYQLPELADELPEIIQIKGKQNAAPAEKYLPFVQDFVKSGKWADVGDLRNTGLVRFSGGVTTFRPQFPISQTQSPRDEAIRGVKYRMPEGFMTTQEAAQFLIDQGAPADWAARHVGDIESLLRRRGYAEGGRVRAEPRGFLPRNFEECVAWLEHQHEIAPNV